jgi:RNA polymerase sigma-70 factor (ECF subfamily)
MTVMDSHWLRQCQQGDVLAIEQLVQTYQSDVYRLALSILDDPAEADDATQDVFVAALRSLDSFHGSASFRTWLFSITLNLCRSRLRRRKGRSLLRQMLENLFQADQPHPESEAIRQETGSELWQAVCALDEKHRIPLVLRYYHDLPVAEIAEMLGIPTGTVHSRLNHAREKLRARLEKMER